MGSERQRIAVIGTGISGLGAAYLLNPHHDVTVYEKNGAPGGHSRTVDVHTLDGTIPVDTGFIVFNDGNYPLLNGLFRHLGVPIADSDMSFAASIDDGWLEYGTQRARNMIAQKRNLLRPAFWRAFRDVLRFNRRARAYLDSDATLGECLEEMRMGPWFRDYFLLAIGGAVWSTPLDRMLDFPARTFIRFFDNHGLLAIDGQPQWRTVLGGSRAYVERISAPFAERMRLDCGARRIVRDEAGVMVEDTRGKTARFDHVVFACHADQALAMIERPTEAERAILGTFSFQPNQAILHSDTGFMPKRRGAWASWVYLLEGRQDKNPAVSLSYWMNRLQPLKTETPIIVTLNPGREPEPSLIHDRHTFEHPVFDTAAIAAQERVGEIQGRDRLWFAGAWLRYGFHEDGLLSAVRVAEGFGIEPPWGPNPW